MAVSVCCAMLVRKIANKIVPPKSRRPDAPTLFDHTGAIPRCYCCIVVFKSRPTDDPSGWSETYEAYLLQIMAKMDALCADEHQEAAGELPTRLAYDGERHVTEADAKFSRLAAMDKHREMANIGGPALGDDLSIGG